MRGRDGGTTQAEVPSPGLISGSVRRKLRSMLYPVLLTALLAASPAAPPSLSCPLVAAGSIRVDGFFNDWQEEQGLRGEAGPGLRWELRAVRDVARLYLVFGAQDDSFVPTPPGARTDAMPPGKRPWAGDHVVLRFGAGGQTLPALAPTVVVLPGDLEDRPPQAAFLPAGIGGQGKATRLSVDGATRPGGGWLLELALPLALLPASVQRPDGLPQVELTVHDVDRVAASGAGPAGAQQGRQELALVFPDHEQNRQALLQRLGLSAATQPALEVMTHVGGDARRERVAIYGCWLTLLGEGLGEGVYYLFQLPFPDRLRPVGLETLDLTGDGAEEMLVRFRVVEQRGEERHAQEFLSVLQYGDDSIHLLFTAEVIHEGPHGQRVVNEVSFGPPEPRRGRSLKIRFKEAHAVDVHCYRDVDEGYDNWYEEILLPWSPYKEATYRYQDGRLLRDL